MIRISIFVKDNISVAKARNSMLACSIFSRADGTSVAVLLANRKNVCVNVFLTGMNTFSVDICYFFEGLVEVDVVVGLKPNNFLCSSIGVNLLGLELLLLLVELGAVNSFRLF